MTTHDTRDPAALRRHYEVERELADRLRNSRPEDRQALYRAVYTELFARVPDHPQNMWKETPEQQTLRTAEQIGILRRYLTPQTVYLEVGAGDCSLTREVAGRVKFAYGVDVTDLLGGSSRPANFELLMTDGATIPLANGLVSVAFSNMLIEHLHPDDFDRHLREVARVLRPGGVYVCRTPHRYTGPQDISQHFDAEATGLHLREYSFRELAARFRAAGFGSVGVRPRVKRRPIPFPAWAMRLSEAALGLLPSRTRKRVCRSPFLRPLFGAITVVGWKDRRDLPACRAARPFPPATS
ncbi:MAG TPA: class I SAM-dependent methyltransferase [Gemmataceae bacterium]|nr:class I SAM-dependent methyltransferase [Gemmataceae bacterium]